MKGLVLITLLGLCLAASAHHSHPVRHHIRNYAPIKADPGVKGTLAIIAGLLDAVGSKTNSTDITGCLTNLADVDTQITAAVAELKEMTWDSVEAGLRDLANAFEAVPTAMNDCAGSITEDSQLLEGLLKKFEHPATFFFQVEEHLMVDGIDILSNVNGALSDWDDSDWYGFGYDVGSALVLVVDGQKKLRLSPTNVLDVIAGLLEGIAADLGLTDIQECLQDVGTLATDIENAYKELVQNSATAVAEGLKDLAQALEQVPSAIKTCKAADTVDIAKIEAALSSFENPVSFVFHVGHDLIINGQQIYTEVNSAIQDYQNQDFEGFGEAVGEALAAVLVGEPETLNVAHALEVVAGLLEGIAADLSLTDIENCISDAESVGVDIHNAYEEILQATFSSVKTGLSDLADALKIVPSAITACKAGATTDVAKVEAMLSAFSNPISFVFHVGKDLILNGKQIFTEVASAVRAYHSKDYTQFGYYMGEAMAAVLVGEKSVVVNVLDVVGGVLEGLATGVALTDIQNCVGDSETIAANLYNAVIELKNATNPTDAKQAIHDFGVALEFLPAAITNCKAAPSEAADIAKMIANFESPLSFIFTLGVNLVVNGNQIYDEMSAAVGDWESQNWYDFGDNLGEALAKTFL